MLYIKLFLIVCFNIEGVVTTSSTIRPMVKVQIPGSTVTLRSAASGVTLAPKPATQDGSTAVNSVATPTLTAIKMPKVVGTVQTPVKGGSCILLCLLVIGEYY